MTVLRDVIVIGASIGGIDAFRTVLGDLPASLKAVVVALIQTAPGNRDAAASLVGERGALPVVYARDGQALEPGRVYLAPPGCHVLVEAPGVLNLAGGPMQVRRSRPAIDLLFQSAAAVYGRRVIGLVLSGIGSDGTDGLRAIKAAGGLSIVQSPADAQAPEMPSNAVLGDSPDRCPLLHDIAPLLAALVQ